MLLKVNQLHESSVTNLASASVFWNDGRLGESWLNKLSYLYFLTEENFSRMIKHT